MNRIFSAILLFIVLYGVFSYGRYFQINYMLEHNDVPSVQKILDKNCTKL